MTTATPRFRLPPALSATEPPEARGLRRDGVRLLVAGAAGVRHARFAELPDHLAPGDLVVVNTSPTLPAAVDAHRTGRGGGAGRAGPLPATVHFATPLDDGSWVVELRRPDGPIRDAVAGERIDLPGGATLTLLAGHPHGGDTSDRLWRASSSTDIPRLLRAGGRPIAYDYVPRRWPLPAYQTVFADGAGAAAGAGSAEMPSAGRPFTTELVTALVSRGITIAPVTLHTGVASLDKHEPPLAERFTVPAATACLVNHTRRAGGRIVAGGTTVTRALETVATPDGTVTPGTGWTDLVLSRHRPARAVTGLITGWHEPDASHLLLLDAVAGPDLVDTAYREAVRSGYLWHEFGDSCLLLP